ncbi:hypothetical protein AB1L30_21620 [Bremerella sp. JC817]|uniref:hypothetical protein n=1 Tax=Bremerella sp. JC817 TaxID=3231756 RepID=UPI003459BFD2
MFVATPRRLLFFVVTSVCVAFAVSTAQAEETLWTTRGASGQLLFSKDGKYAWSSVPGDTNVTIRENNVWEMPAGTKVSGWQDRASTVFRHFLNDGKHLLQIGQAYTETNEARNEGRVIELATGKSILDVDVPSRIISVVVTKDDKVYFFTLQGSTQFDTKTGEQKLVSDIIASQVAIMPESGRVLAVMDPLGELQDSVYVFNSMADFLAKRKPRYKFGPFEVAHVTPAPDDKTVVIRHLATGNDGLEVESFTCVDVVRGRRLAQYQLANPSGIGEPDYFSADGKWVMTGAPPTITVFNVEKKEGTPHEDDKTPVGFTPGSALILSVYGKPFQFLDPATYQPLDTPLEEKWLKVPAKSGRR